MRFDFFHIEGPDTDKLGALIATAASLPNNASRTKEVDKVWCRLRHTEKGTGGRWWLGEMVRLRIGECPLVGDTDGKLEEVHLESNEGPAAETVFLYDPKTHVLVIQGGRSGVNAARFCRYWEAMGRLEHPLLPRMIPKKTLVTRLNKVKIVRNYVVKLAGIENPELIVGHGPGTKTGVRLLANSFAPQVKIELAVGRGSGTLSVNDVVDCVKNLVSGDAPVPAVQLTSVILKGKNKDGSPADFDLLEFVMMERIRVKKPKGGRVTYEARRDAICQAWQSKLADVEQIYPVGN
jgi:hypothetical protein